MKANAVRLQLHALAYNLANFLRTLVLPDEMARWSLTTIREMVEIGGKVIAHARYTVSQMAEVAVPRDLFRSLLKRIDDLRPRCRKMGRNRAAGADPDRRSDDYAATDAIATTFHLPVGPESGYFGVCNGWMGHPYGECRLI